MNITTEIISEIAATTREMFDHTDYPRKPGIYAFALSNYSSLKQFGNGEQIIYVGIAKTSLKTRDINIHFKSGKTGNSTLRRSIGAILKSELALTPFSRDGSFSKIAIYNYKFQGDGEVRLSNWMMENLRVGYWEEKDKISYSALRILELGVIKELRPTLDLDPRTRKLNALANELDCLRNICRQEVIKNNQW